MDDLIDKKQQKSEYDAMHYIANQERILARKATTIKCTCGALIRKDSKARHIKTAKHTREV